MPPKLKVYTAQIDGLHDWVVAAPNQRAALDAFGVRQNLFAQGEASETKDAKAVAAALAKPGAPLRRSKGKGDYAMPDLGADFSAALADEAGRPRRRRPDRRGLEKAIAALAEMEQESDKAIAALDEAQARLDRERAQVAQQFDERRQALAEAVAEAKRRIDEAN